MAEVSMEQQRFKNTVGRLLFELLYGSSFESSKGLSRTFKVPVMAKQCNVRASHLVKILKFSKDAGLLDKLEIDYKTVNVTLAAPVGIKKKAE